MASLQSTSSVYAEKGIWAIPVLCTCPLGKLQEVGASYGLSIDKFNSNCHSHFLSEGKMVLDGWMTVPRTRSAGIQRPPVFRAPARPIQTLLCTGRLSWAQVLAWRLFLSSWPEKNGLWFCEVHWKDSSWLLNVRTHFTALNHISFVAQHNFCSNLCSCQFWHPIWFYEPCWPSMNRFVLLT